MGFTGMVGHFGQLDKHRRFLAPQGARQARKGQRQSVWLHLRIGGTQWQHLRLLAQQGFKQGAVNRLAALAGDAQHKAAFLRDAFLTAHQPVGLQHHFGRFRQTGRCVQGHGRGQQNLTFEAIVGHLTHPDFFRDGPMGIANRPARGRLPLQLGGQARVPRVFPVGVPIFLMLDVQTQPHGLTWPQALGGPDHQFRSHLRRGDHRWVALCPKAAHKTQGQGQSGQAIAKVDKAEHGMSMVANGSKHLSVSRFVVWQSP